MTDTPPPIPVDAGLILEPENAGAEGDLDHTAPAELVELHGIIELANNGGPT